MPKADGRTPVRAPQKPHRHRTAARRGSSARRAAVNLRGSIEPADYKRYVLPTINEIDVREVLTSGEVIESYPDDTPYPSRLVLGWRGSRFTNPTPIFGKPGSDGGASDEVRDLQAW